MKGDVNLPGYVVWVIIGLIGLAVMVLLAGIYSGGLASNLERVCSFLWC